MKQQQQQKKMNKIYNIEKINSPGYRNGAFYRIVGVDCIEM